MKTKTKEERDAALKRISNEAIAHAVNELENQGKQAGERGRVSIYLVF